MLFVETKGQRGSRRACRALQLGQQGRHRQAGSSQGGPGWMSTGVPPLGSWPKKPGLVKPSSSVLGEQETRPAPAVLTGLGWIRTWVPILPPLMTLQITSPTFVSLFVLCWPYWILSRIKWHNIKKIETKTKRRPSHLERYKTFLKLNFGCKGKYTLKR